MRRQVRKRKCKNCKIYFLPDPRNRRRQRFCSHPSCQKASKADSQRRWLQKPENQNEFKCAHNVKRVQAWRKNHPDYWRRRKTDKEKALQEPLPGEIVAEREDETPLTEDASQDSLSVENLEGREVEASLTENALQDSLSAENLEGRAVETSLTEDALQDVLSAQGPVLLGLIAQLTGSALQDNIAATTRRLRQLGDDILNHQFPQEGGCDDLKTPPMSESNPKTPGGVRLVGSPSGP